jgi:hypothetical protein
MKLFHAECFSNLVTTTLKSEMIIFGRFVYTFKSSGTFEATREGNLVGLLVVV